MSDERSATVIDLKNARVRRLLRILGTLVEHHDAAEERLDEIERTKLAASIDSCLRELDDARLKTADAAQNGRGGER